MRHASLPTSRTSPTSSTPATHAMGARSWWRCPSIRISSSVSTRASATSRRRRTSRRKKMATVYYDTDADPRALRGKTIAVIGYGSQGHAHAQNLRDSGCDVVVGLQAGSKSWAKAELDGFTVRETADAARGADVIALLVPDQHHREAYAKIAPFMGKGRTLLVAHAFSVHFGEVKP